MADGTPRLEVQAIDPSLPGNAELARNVAGLAVSGVLRNAGPEELGHIVGDIVDEASDLSNGKRIMALLRDGLVVGGAVVKERSGGIDHVPEVSIDFLSIGSDERGGDWPGRDFLLGIHDWARQQHASRIVVDDPASGSTIGRALRIMGYRHEQVDHIAERHVFDLVQPTDRPIDSV